MDKDVKRGEWENICDRREYEIHILALKSFAKLFIRIETSQLVKFLLSKISLFPDLFPI